MAALSIPVSYGEAVDKITILEIKRERIRDPAKLANVEKELGWLSQAFATIESNADICDMRARLRAINERLWDIEEAIREHERGGDFGAAFVQLARAVYRLNDDRARTKQSIDVILGSSIREEKSYVDHDGGK
ncbi:MAG TPA: DUF6165 family protein [Rhizomicrobium sp.]|jgi:hypothetical protein|nr:DUF6165 family protein [Rhizomicrobium sp.]